MKKNKFENSLLIYDKEYLLNGLPGWIEKFCGAKPILDAKGISEVNKVLTIKYIYLDYIIYLKQRRMKSSSI